MAYAFLVFAILWVAQFGFTYQQMIRFNRRITALRKLGRVSVGMHGDRWRGRTYAVLVVDPADRIERIEVLAGWTVFAKLVPLTALDQQPISVLEQATPLAGVTARQWAAIKHAVTFLKPAPAPAVTARLAADS